MNKYRGQSFDDFLKEEGIYEEVTVEALTNIVQRQRELLNNKWNKVEFSGNYPHIPRDESIFLVIWKGRISLAQYCKEEGRFFISFAPAEYEWSVKLDQDRENKFTYWMPLPEAPKDDE